MLTITLDHHGNIILSSLERSNPIQRKLKLTIGKISETPETVMFALEEELHAVILEYLGVTFDNCVQPNIRTDSTNFLINSMRTEITNSFIEKIRVGITSNLKSKGVISFSIERC